VQRCESWVRDAETNKKLSSDDAKALRLKFASQHHQQGKKLNVAFAHAIKLGIFTAAEVQDLKELLDYRNDIAHRIHLVMSDLSPEYWVSHHLSFTAPTYKGDALDRLRAYYCFLMRRVEGRYIVTISMRSGDFAFAELAYENELKRLDRLIQKQIAREQCRIQTINAEMDLQATELVGDLAPRFPANHRSGLVYHDEYKPPSGHLTKRGVEICNRLFDLGKSPIAVAYLMGMSLRAAERRRQRWLAAGGFQRSRAEVKRYDPEISRVGLRERIEAPGAVPPT
jgi:hypothetical protein